MPSFITPTDFLLRYDFRWVGKNITDNGIAADQGQCAASPVIAAFIQEASDMVMAAAAIGDRYSLDDITKYGGTLLTRIVSDLTMGLILKRRARALDDEKSLSGPYEEALEYLELLRRGERIFYAVPNVPEAGLPATATMLPTPGIQPPLISENTRIFGLIGPCRWPGGW